MGLFDKSDKQQNKRPKPVVLVVMDGVGFAPPGPGNAVTLASTPSLNSYYVAHPHGPLNASGSAVGLPHGVMGNSEVGHLNIGAGQVVYQELPRINRSIEDMSFYENPVFKQTLDHALQNKSRIHLMGLSSDGKVHSSLEHLFALILLCRDKGIDKDNLIVHCFADGRDTPTRSAKIFIDEVMGELKRRKIGRIGSICGRYFAMDRNNKWERTKKAYDLLTKGVGEKASDPLKALQAAYDKDQTDEFIEPIFITGEDQQSSAIQENDSVIFFNYRPDRGRQLTAAFTEPDFNKFDRGPMIQNLLFTTLTEYKKGLNVLVAFPPQDIPMPLGRIISEHDMRQLRIAETEKYPHVTYFFNGGRENPFPGEDRILVPSPKVATYDEKPEMSANELTKVLIHMINKDIYDLILVNYANPDMVGHTGNIPAAIKAVETVDACVEKVIKTTLAKDGVVILVADHGNCETMLNFQTGEPDTNHTTNRVPFCFISKNPERRELPIGILADIAPTVLNIMGLEKPSSMTGRNLIA